jgi:hypothetical protein
MVGRDDKMMQGENDLAGDKDNALFWEPGAVFEPLI